VDSIWRGGRRGEWEEEAAEEPEKVGEVREGYWRVGEVKTDGEDTGEKVGEAIAGS